MEIGKVDFVLTDFSVAVKALKSWILQFLTLDSEQVYVDIYSLCSYCFENNQINNAYLKEKKG